MASKAFQQICRFLENKDFKYGTDVEGTEQEAIFFGAQGVVQQKFLFTIEPKASVVQFRSIQILDEDDLKSYHSKQDNKLKLFEYLLKCNYEWKLGKFALDPEDPDVNLYFVISDYVDANVGIEEEFLDRVSTILFGPSFGPSHTETAIKNIKSILATGEMNEETETDSLGSQLEQLVEELAKNPEMARSVMSDPNTPQELKNMLKKVLGQLAPSPEELAKRAQELLAQGKIAEATAIIAQLSGNNTPLSDEDGI